MFYTDPSEINTIVGHAMNKCGGGGGYFKQKYIFFF